MNDWERGFYAGVNAALAVLHMNGETGNTHYNEIVRACGVDRLVAEARRSGTMKISGLSQWVKEYGIRERNTSKRSTRAIREQPDVSHDL